MEISSVAAPESIARSLLAPDLTSTGYAPAVATCPNVSATAVAAYDENNPSAAAVSDGLLIEAVHSLWNKLCGYSETAGPETAAA